MEVFSVIEVLVSCALNVIVWGGGANRLPRSKSNDFVVDLFAFSENVQMYFTNCSTSGR